MSKSKLVAVLDRKAQNFSGICPVPSLEVGKRMYADLLANGDSIVTRHPEDFDLYLLGDIDLDSGVIAPLAIPEFVANSSEVTNVQKTN